MGEDIFRGVGVEITLNKPDDFLKVKETLTRIGVASKDKNVLYQSCYILHKQGRYSILHFKELFILDGKPSSITDNDIGRRNTIVGLLSQWGLANVVKKEEFFNNKDGVSSNLFVPISQIKIIPFKEKSNWTLMQKYTIGRKGPEVKPE